MVKKILTKKDSYNYNSNKDFDDFSSCLISSRMGILEITYCIFRLIFIIRVRDKTNAMENRKICWLLIHFQFKTEPSSAQHTQNIKPLIVLITFHFFQERTIFKWTYLEMSLKRNLILSFNQLYRKHFEIYKQTVYASSLK